VVFVRIHQICATHFLQKNEFWKKFFSARAHFLHPLEPPEAIPEPHRRAINRARRSFRRQAVAAAMKIALKVSFDQGWDSSKCGVANNSAKKADAAPLRDQLLTTTRTIRANSRACEPRADESDRSRTKSLVRKK
jgi:hypothetical protein